MPPIARHGRRIDHIDIVEQWTQQSGDCRRNQRPRVQCRHIAVEFDCNALQARLRQLAAKLPSFSASDIYGFRCGASSAVTDGILIALETAPDSK